jgi:hypothetical protein
MTNDSCYRLQGKKETCGVLIGKFIFDYFLKEVFEKKIFGLEKGESGND